MKTSKLKAIKGVYVIGNELQKDFVHGRLLSYSWDILAEQNINSFFQYIYRWKYLNEREFRGFFVFVNGEIYLSCMQGKLKLYLLDLRLDSETYMKSSVVTVSPAEGRPDASFQHVYLPQNVAFGILNLSAKTVLQGACTKRIDETTTFILNPLDNALDLKIEEEFLFHNRKTLLSLQDIEEIIAHQ